MECSELCPYNNTKFNCEVPKLNEEQVKNLKIVNKISNNLYSGYISNHPILISTQNNSGICTQLEVYSFSPQILGAWRCQLTNQSITIMENSDYRLLNKDISDYNNAILAAYHLNISGFKHNNIKSDTILFPNSGGLPKFLDFSRARQFTFPEFDPNKLKADRDSLSDLYDINKLFTELGQLPEWDRLFQDFYKRNSYYPENEDIDNIIKLRFGLDRINLGRDMSMSIVGAKYLTNALAVQLNILSSVNCGTPFSGKDIDFVVLLYEEYSIEAFFTVKIKTKYPNIQGYLLDEIHQISNFCMSKRLTNKALFSNLLNKYIMTRVKRGGITEIYITGEVDSDISSNFTFAEKQGNVSKFVSKRA